MLNSVRSHRAGSIAAVALAIAAPAGGGAPWAAGATAPPPVAGAAAQPPAPALYDPKRPPERELETSIAGRFSIAAVGDCIITVPLAPYLTSDPEFARAVAILRDADVAFGNFETTAIDLDSFRGYPYPGAGDWGMTSVPGVARDLRTFGFDLLARANNHALDWGVEGMRETSRWLDEAGLVHAGAGENRAQARAPRYLVTPAGRVALVSMASTYGDSTDAQPPSGRAPARPGISALRTTRTTIVTGPMMRALAGLKGTLDAAAGRCGGYEAPDAAPASTPALTPARSAAPGTTTEPPRELELFDTRFQLGERPGYHYEIDPIDRDEILRTVRLGKQHADFLIATIHAHETAIDCEQPGDFLPILARAAIDAGADAFFVHGSHLLGPVEIYRGKPILYGLGNFFWSDIVEPLPAGFQEQSRDLLAAALGDPAKGTEADLNALLNATSFNDDRIFQSVIAVARWDAGRLTELRLHPIDLRYGERLTRSGLPRPAPRAAARAILDRIQRLSQAFGTTVVIDKNTGVIQVQ